MAKSKQENMKSVNAKGLRSDGRKANESRPIKIKVGVVDRADGSAEITWGHNKAIAAVYGPKEVVPRHMANPFKAIVRFYYRMAPFSVSDHKRPAPGRREHEISKVCGEALAAAVLTEKFPNSQIEVHVEMLDMDAGSRTTALTAASVALAAAGIPMRDLVTSCAVGRAGGELLVDLTKEEEDYDDAVDMAVAMMPNLDEVVLLQMDAKPPYFSKEEVSESLKLVKEAMLDIYEIQKQALKDGFAIPEKAASTEGGE
ncbi:MAG: exosome complex exonuclease Rrp41 [Candidatus Diapherotrites archaeon]|nr:exosome complex exonuclease Rrp41 [Candidatus Diapherotrites archaeon]